MNATEKTSHSRASVMECGTEVPPWNGPKNSPALPKQDAKHEAEQHPEHEPGQSAQPLPPQHPPTLQTELKKLKTALQNLDESCEQTQLHNALLQLFTPLISVLSVSSCKNSSSPLPEDFDELDQELAAAAAQKPRSKLDQLPEDQQEHLFDLLQTYDHRFLAPKICKAWKIETSGSALYTFKKRYQAKLDAAEQAKVQAELNHLASAQAPDYTQAAEKILQLRAIKITKDPNSKPDDICKAFNTLTRFMNAQTAQARLQFQIQKSSAAGDTAPTNPDENDPGAPC